MTLPQPNRTEVERIEADPAKLLDVRRTGMGVKAYMKMLRLDPCAYCGRWPVYVEIDHMEPRSEGGANHWTNYTAACGGCNAFKLNDRPLQWLWRLRYEIPEFIREYQASRPVVRRVRVSA